MTKSLESHEIYVSLPYEFEYEICCLLRIHSLYEVSFLVKIILLSLHIYPATWNRVTLTSKNAGTGQPATGGHLVHQYDRACPCVSGS